MRLNNRMFVLFVSMALIAASSGCATHVGGRAAGSVTINQTFTDTPLRDVLIAIEKACSLGIATDASVDVDKKISVRLEEVSADEAVAAVAKAAGYQWAFDHNLSDKLQTDQPLHGQYWPYPMYLIAKEVDKSVFPISEEEAARARWIARFEEGEELCEAGNYDMAKEVLEEVQASGVSLGSITDRKLASYVNMINEEEARAEAELKQAKQKEHLMAELSVVRELLEAGRYQPALDKAERIEAEKISLGVDNDAALKEYKKVAESKIAEEQGKIEAGRKKRDEAQELYAEAASLYSQGDYEAAQRAYTDVKAKAEHLTSRQFGNVEKRLDSIDRLIARQRAEERQQAEKRMEQKRKDKGIVLFKEGERLYKAGSYDAAEAIFEEVRAADVSLGWSANRKLSSYLNDIQKKQAKEESLKEIKRKLSIGIQHYKAGDYQAAIDLLSEVEGSKLASWTLRSSAREYREKAESRLAAESQTEMLIAKLPEVKALLEAGRYDEVIATTSEIEAKGISLGEMNDARLKEYRRIARTKMAEEIQRIESGRVARIECEALLDKAASLYLTGELEPAREVYSKLASMSEHMDPYQLATVDSRLNEIEVALAAKVEARREEEAREAAAAVAEVKEEPTPDIHVASANNSSPPVPAPTPEAAKLALEKEKEAERLAKQPKVSNVFFNTDIREAISDMAAQTGVNIITDASVEGWVTLSLEEVPLEKALSMMCLSGGFTWRNMGDYYLVGAATPESVNYPLLSKTEAVRTNLPASQVRDRLSEFFVPYTRVASEEDHVLIVTGAEAVVENVINTINAIDGPRHQIKIEAIITEISWSADSDKGMNWMNTLMDLDAGGVMDFAKGTGPTYSSTIVGTVIAQLSALAQTGKIDIKANPTIVTLEGETAEIKIVEERYFSIVTGSLSFPTSDLEIIESGVILSVTPVVTRSGDILLSIVPDVSDVTGTSGGREDLPIITRRSVKSNVRVNDGETVVLGGLLKHLSREIIRKIPVLGSIPIISFAFRNKTTQDTDTELVVFITPTILPD